MILIVFTDYARLSIPQLFVKDSGLSLRNSVTKLASSDVSDEYSAFVFKIRVFREDFKPLFLVP